MPTFASPTYFLDMLAARYAVPTESDVGSDAHRETYAPIQLRVLKLIKYWVDQFYFDYFAHDPKLHAALLRFLQDRCTQDYVKPHVEALLRNVSDASSLSPFRDASQTLSYGSPKASLAADEIDPHLVSLADFAAVDVARQLVLRVHAIARVIEWHSLNKHALEAIARQFGSNGEQDPLSVAGTAPLSAPAALPANVVALAHAYWEMRQFVEDEVLVCVHAAADGITNSAAVVARQQALVEHFVDVAIELFNVRCYLASFALVAVLHGKLAKKQLKSAWKTVSKKKEARLGEIFILSSPKKHFKDLRAHTATDEPHAQTPWPPAVADWLLEVMASAPDFLPSGLGDLIDIDKRIRVAAQLRRLRATQHTPYPFRVSPFLAAYFGMTPTARRHVDGGGNGSAEVPRVRRVASRDDNEQLDETDDGAIDDTGDLPHDEATEGSDDEGSIATRPRRPSTLSDSASASNSPSLKARSGSISAASVASPSKRSLGGLVRSLTRSQRSSSVSKRSDEAPIPASAAPSQAAAPSAVSPSLGESLTRSRSSSIGKSTRKSAHPTGASTLRTGSRQEEERSEGDDDGSDTDSAGGADDAQLDAMNSPRLLASRRALRARATADASASKNEQAGFVSMLEATGTPGDAATLRTVLLNALKQSAAARHMFCERLNVAAAGQLAAPSKLFDAQDEERLRAADRVREALDLAISQTSHLNAYISTARMTNDTHSSSPLSSPRSDRAASPANVFSFPAETAVARLLSTERAGRLRSSSLESHSSQESSPRHSAPSDSRSRLNSLGPAFSLMSNSSASAASLVSPRIAMSGTLSRRISTLHVLPEIDTSLVTALSYVYPGRVIHYTTIDDKLGRVYGWPTSVELLVLDDDRTVTDDQAVVTLPATGISKTGQMGMMLNAFRATGDGIAADDAEAGRALPLSVCTAIDAAELAAFVRMCKVFATTSPVAPKTFVVGVLAVRLIDDNVARHATDHGVRIITY